MSSQRVGVVACRELEPVVESLAPTAPTVFVDPAHHESPLDPGDDAAAETAVQAAVDAVDDPSLAYVALAYPRSCDGLDAVTTSDAPLVAWRASDCIEALCDRPPGPHGEAKAPRTYYLTPGAIEHAPDPLKLFLAYTGEVDDLLDDQRDAGLAPTWHESDRLAAARTQSSPPDTGLVRRQFAAQFGRFERVVLLDTGHAAAPHRAYAHRLGDFLASLGTTDGVAVEVADADVSTLAALLSGRALDDPRFERLAAGRDAADHTPITSHP